MEAQRAEGSHSIAELDANGCCLSRPTVQNAANFATLREIEDRLKSIRNIEKVRTLIP